MFNVLLYEPNGFENVINLSCQGPESVTTSQCFYSQCYTGRFLTVISHVNQATQKIIVEKRCMT